MNSGIYFIVNILSGKFYIGSTADFKQRESAHFYELKNKTHGNRHLQSSFNKNPNGFVFIKMEHINQEDLLVVEQKYLDLYWDSGEICYNISKYATAFMKGRKHTEETILKIKESWTPEKRKDFGERFWTEEKRQKLIERNKSENSPSKTPEARKKQSEKISGENHPNWNKKLSKETILKLKENNARYFLGKFGDEHPNSKPVEQIDKVTNEIVQRFACAREAHRKTGIEYKNISAVCLGKRRHAGGFKWRFYEDD